MRAWLLGALVVVASATCVRLGFWQLSRMHEKHALHAAQRALLAEPPIEVAERLPATSPESGRRVHLRGRWDPSVHVLLSGRTHMGAAGVSLVSALRLDSGEAVLVERGWLPAADSRSAHPERMVDSTAEASGVALALEPARRPTPWFALPSLDDRARLWSARALDRDSVAARIAGPLAAWMLRALPEEPPGAARAAPAPRAGGERAIPEPYQVPDEAMHLSYAIQWFAFAAIIAGGSLALATRRRPAAG